MDKKPAISGATTEFLIPSNAKLLRQIAAAAGWVWMFAAFSVVNLILAHVQVPMRIMVSFIFTEFLFEVGRAVGPVFAGAGLIIAAMSLGFVAFLGFQIKRDRGWAFVAAISLLAIDAVLIYFITTLAGLWTFLLHMLAIYFLWVGLKAAKLINQRKAKEQT